MKGEWQCNVISAHENQPVKKREGKHGNKDVKDSSVVWICAVNGRGSLKGSVAAQNEWERLHLRDKVKKKVGL